MVLFGLRKSFSWKAGLLNTVWATYYAIIVVLLTTTDSYTFGTIFNDVKSVFLTMSLVGLGILFITSGFVEPKVKGA